jgi:hypothetical protein
MTTETVFTLMSGFLGNKEVESAAGALRRDPVDMLRFSIMERYGKGFLTEDERDACKTMTNVLALPDSLRLRLYHREELIKSVYTDPVLDARTKARIVMYINCKSSAFGPLYDWYMALSETTRCLDHHTACAVMGSLEHSPEVVVLGKLKFSKNSEGFMAQCWKTGRPLVSCNIETLRLRYLSLERDLCVALSSAFVFNTLVQAQKEQCF